MDLLLLFLVETIITLSVFSFEASAGRTPAIIVFGDSSVDPGNNNQIPTIAKSNFDPYGRDFIGSTVPTGRFCNGRLATDFISEAMGLKVAVPAFLDPAYGIEDFADGVSFGSAGTGLDSNTSRVLSVLSLRQELEFFKEYRQRLQNFMGDPMANRTTKEALYIISIGTNDFLENYYLVPGGPSSRFTVEEYESFLLTIAGDFISDIYRLGGRHISVTGLCPMGCMPLVRTRSVVSGKGSGCNEEYNRVSIDFNAKLQLLLEDLNGRLPGVDLVYSDVYDIFNHVLQKPYLFGFDEVKKGCCATGLYEMGYACDRWNPFTCENANEYVFWDAFHPTEAMYRIVANHLIDTSLSKFM